MIGNHQASLRRDIVGIGLCAVVGVFALTKAPQSVADVISEQPLSLNVREIPITKVVELIRDFSGSATIIGLFSYEERGAALAIGPLEGGVPGAACGAGMRLN